MIDVKIYRKPAEFIEFKKEWDDLFLSGKFEPSVSFEWTQSLMETHVQGEECFLVVLSQSKEVLGLVPLVIKRRKKLGMTVRYIIPLGELYNTHSDLLLKTNSSDLISGFISALFTLKKKWDVCHISRFAENNIVFQQIQDVLNSSSNYQFEIKQEEPSYFVPLDCNFNDYLKNRSSNFRSSLSKNEKKLNKKGTVHIKKNKDFTNFNDLYGHILKIEEKSWKHKEGTAISSVKKQHDFYEKLFQRAFEGGWSNLSILYLNDEPVAYNMGLIKNENYYYLKTSFSEDFRSLGPSGFLRIKLVEDLIHEGIKELDFTGEPYEWQCHWTNHLRGHRSVRIFSHSWRGRLFSVYNRLKRRSETGGSEQNQEVQFHDPRALKPDLK